MPYCIQCGCTASYRIPEGDNRERIVCDDASCGYIHYQNPNPVCGALVVHEDKILLCRRAIEPQYGMWTLPAGFMEIGETMLEGARRETVEEADAIATDLKLYCLFDIPELGQVHVMYLANLQDGKFGVGTESLECALFTEEDIDWDDIAFETVKRTLRYYLNDRKAVDNSNNDFINFPLYEETLIKNRGKKV